MVPATGTARSGTALIEATGPPSSLPQPLAIVGAGRMGRALTAALRAAGVPVSGPHGRGYTGAGDAVVLLCVPDGAIAAAAAIIDPAALVGHCSGASGLEVLGDREGFSVHPLMTVTPAGADFRGVWAAVDGSSPRGLAVAQALAATVGLRPARVAAADRAAYHAAASIASNYLITVQAAAAELMATAGLDRAVLLPLARAALENWGALGPAALTGPVARGDTHTVARHRAAMVERTPELVELLDALVAATERLARQAPPPSSIEPPSSGVEPSPSGVEPSSGPGSSS